MVIIFFFPLRFESLNYFILLLMDLLMFYEVVIQRCATFNIHLNFHRYLTLIFEWKLRHNLISALQILSYRMVHTLESRYHYFLFFYFLHYRVEIPRK